MARWFNALVARVALPAVPEPILWPFARRYVAGKTLDEACRCVRRLMDLGCCATLDILGEEITDPAETRRIAGLYVEALDRIASEGLDSNVSLKPTAMGLRVDPDLCAENMRTVVQAAGERDNFVRFDMEDTSCVDPTLALYRRLRSEGYDNIGIVLQSRLRRTLGDVDAMADLRPIYRLCKGIYEEPPETAWQHDEAVNGNYSLALETMLRGGSYVGIATHDERLVWAAERLIRELKVDKEAYEFQMLLGVSGRLRKVLVSQGHKMRVYVPYGGLWRDYSVRRLQANPKLVGQIMGNLFDR